MTRRYQRPLNYFVYGLLLLWAAAQLPGLATNPPVWFDEAWTLMVAKNWVTQGVYGRSLGAGYVSGIGMAMPITSTGWFALLFQATGFSIFYARLLALGVTVGTLFLIVHYTRKLYTAGTALLTLIVLLFFSLPGTHPFWFGKQALAEPFLILYIVSGYYCFSLSFNDKRWVLPAIFLLGLGAHAKSHALPFLLAGLLGTAAVAWWHGRPRLARRFAATGVGVLVVFFALIQLEYFTVHGLPFYGGPIMQAVFMTVGLVTQPAVRLKTAQYLLGFGGLLLAGLLVALRTHWRFIFSQPPAQTPEADYVRLSYFGFIFSWFVWFASLSIGWERYLYPIFFLSAPLQALALKAFFERIWGSGQAKMRKRLVTLLALVPLGLFAAFTLASNLFTFQLRNTHLQDTAAYIEAHVPAGETVESYDGEIFLLLDNHAAHYPPDDVQVQLVRRRSLGEPQTLTYDPFALAPAVIVAGPFGKVWQLYPASLMAEHGYTLTYENDAYRVYARP